MTCSSLTSGGVILCMDGTQWRTKWRTQWRTCSSLTSGGVRLQEAYCRATSLVELFSAGGVYSVGDAAGIPMEDGMLYLLHTPGEMLQVFLWRRACYTSGIMHTRISGIPAKAVAHSGGDAAGIRTEDYMLYLW